MWLAAAGGTSGDNIAKIALLGFLVKGKD